MIFNLDRFIVSGMRKRTSSWSEWKLAFPRLVLAVLLAFVISKPLELKIFEKQQPGIDRFNGMAARMDALGDLTEESQTMAMANIFIILFAFGTGYF
jgi:hypothetical protein